MLPDAVAGNGVRSGSGTAQDPYVISDWALASDERDGIYLRDVSAHVVIRNVHVAQDRAREESRGIWLYNAANVRLERVNISGVQGHGLSVWTSDVMVEDSVISTEAAGPDTIGRVVECARSNLTMRDSRLLGGIPFLWAEPLAGGPCYRVVLEGIHVDPMTPSELGVLEIKREVVIRNTTGYWNVLVLLGQDGKRAIIEDNQLLGLKLGDLSGGDATLGPRTISVRNNTFRYECEDPCPVEWAISYGLVPGWQARVIDNDIRGFGGDAFLFEDSPFVARRNVIVDSGWVFPEALIRVSPDPGLYTEAQEQGVPYQVVTENDIVRSPRDRDGRGLDYSMLPGEAGPLNAENIYWGPEPPTQEFLGEFRPAQPRWSVDPDADIEPWAEEPFFLSADEVDAYIARELPGPGVLVVAAALALAVVWMARRRR